MARRSSTSAALDDYVDFLRSEPRLEEVEPRLEHLAHEFGFTYHAYALIRLPKAREFSHSLIGGGAEDRKRLGDRGQWIDRYDQGAQHSSDPILKAVWSHYFPFRWDQLELEEDQDAQQQGFYRATQEIGIRSGMTIPLHGPAEGLSALSLAGDLSVEDLEDRWDDYRVELFTAAAFTHQVIVEAATRPCRAVDVHLSSRELECLKWTAEGKTTWEVSRILNLSKDTTRFYLREATRKFGVHSKHHAVVKAIAAGLINP